MVLFCLTTVRESKVMAGKYGQRFIANLTRCDFSFGPPCFHTWVAQQKSTFLTLSKVGLHFYYFLIKLMCYVVSVFAFLLSFNNFNLLFCALQACLKTLPTPTKLTRKIVCVSKTNKLVSNK